LNPKTQRLPGVTLNRFPRAARRLSSTTAAVLEGPTHRSLLRDLNSLTDLPWRIIFIGLRDWAYGF
jgi:hypothetical protein